MRHSLNSLLEELQRLKLAGQGSVSVSESSLEALRNAVAKKALASQALPDDTAPPPPSKPPAPYEASLTPRLEPPQASRKYADKGPSGFEAYLAQGQKGAAKSIQTSNTPPRNQAPALPDVPELKLPETDKTEQFKWLREQLLADPTARTLSAEGKEPRLGSGSLDSKIVFICEAPTEDEENNRPPEPGSGGELLHKMIQGMGFKREEVFLTNMLCWRPQGQSGRSVSIKSNRDPSLQEMAYCLPYLKAQIQIIRPQLLVAFGATAAKGLLGPLGSSSFLETRGTWSTFEGLPLMITYHPNYLLHKGKEGKEAERKAKRTVWEDLLGVMAKAEVPISEKQKGYFL